MGTIQEILSQANFYTDDAEYRLIRLPARAITAAAGVIAEVGEAYIALIADKDEVTLILDDEAVQEYGHRLLGHESGETRYRLITIDAVLEPDLIGFMAYLSAALAAVNIPIFPYAAFTRDHLLVPSHQFELALSTLQQLKEKL